MTQGNPINQAKSSIARSLILKTVLFSVFITLLTTGVQLFMDYQNNVNAIHSRIE